MKRLYFLFVWATFFQSGDPYGFKIQTGKGESIKLSKFAGKKILIVNTAGNSKYSNQYDSLELLASQFSNKLVVIVFPSNSFNHEASDNAMISNKLNSKNLHFLLSVKVDVIGNSQDSLFEWLSKKELNGMLDCNILLDFQKFLIDEQGQLIGIFAPSVSPLSDEIKNAINIK